MRKPTFACAAVVVASMILVQAATGAERNTGPWDLEELAAAPTVTWIDQGGMIRSLLYSGEPYQGKPTRVFAYYGTPDNVQSGGKHPAMVLVHGGGGAAFREWVELWVKRGYVAIAMDLAGRDADKARLPDGGPDQSHRQKFDDLDLGAKNAWTYHAVANVIRAASLLTSRPEVDPERIGITGISWGGYLTCLVAGLDQRLKVAVPVYGCGFLHENSAWLKDFERLGPELAKGWVTNFDPSQYLAGAEMPTLFVNGTNDFAYPLDSYQKSYREVKGPRTLCVTVRMPHGHQAGWRPSEIGLFVDSILRKGQPLARVTSCSREGEAVGVKFEAAVPVVSAAIHYTTDAGPWPERNWKSVPAKLADNSATATLPVEKGIVYFVTLTDQRGATVSTEHDSIDG